MTRFASSDVLQSLLAPRSVAVIGASEDPYVFSGATIHNLRAHGYRGTIHPVNPGRDEVQGLPCVARVSDIPTPVDTAVLVLPAAKVIEALEDCERAGVRTATVVSAGFGEEGAGPEGQRNGKQLDDFLATSKLRVLGPNTAGLLNLHEDYAPRAAVNHLAPDRLRCGSVALITQSGACSNIVFNLAQANGVGVGLMCATGDEADIDVWDLAAYAIDSPRITVVMIVAEGTGSPDKVRSVAERARRTGKPIVLLKLGTSEIGRQVVLTHSGSLAGDAIVLRAAMRAWGVLLVDDFDQLWETARLFEAWGATGAGTKRVGVFAFSGGEAALVADHAGHPEIVLTDPGAAFRDRVADVLKYAAAANPFDATGELVGRPDKLEPVLRAFLSTGGFDEVLIATPVYRSTAAERILPVLAAVLADPEYAEHRIALSMWPAAPLTDRQQELLIATGRPVLHGSHRGIEAIARYARHCSDSARYRHHEADPRAILSAGHGTTIASSAFRPTLYHDVRLVLVDAGLPLGRATLTDTADAAVFAAQELGWPVVMKANVPSTTHKAELGAVRVGIGDSAAVRAAFEELVAIAGTTGGRGVVVEQTAFGSVQLIVGARVDPTFGRVMVVGSGGATAEYLDDSAVALAASADATSMRALLEQTKVGRFLTARYVGIAAQVVDILTDLAAWFAGSSAAAVDVNPVLVDPASARVTCVDARVEWA